MTAAIQSPAKCEVRCVIRFLNAKGERPAEIHKQIVAVCGNVMISTCFFTQGNIGGKKFDDDDEVQEEVMRCFKEQAADFYDSGIQKLVPRPNKCLENSGDYVEK
jgi:hypothetical protein